MKKLLITLALLLSFNPVLAKEPVEQLKAFLEDSKTLKSRFKQVVFDELGKEKQVSHGLFYLSRPGKFRWYYQKPFIQEIVSSSGKVWFYDADLEQVTIKKLDKSMGSTPALLLSGEVELEAEFTLESQGEDDGILWIKLLPKSEDSSFKYVLIGLEKGVLGAMELSDNFGQLTRVYFTEVELNVELDEKEFVFTVPEGADVFED